MIAQAYPTERYVRVANVYTGPALSAVAFKALAFWTAKPKHWRPCVDRDAVLMGESRTALRRAVTNELIPAGLFTRLRTRLPSGRFEWRNIVYPLPQVSVGVDGKSPGQTMRVQGAHGDLSSLRLTSLVPAEREEEPMPSKLVGRDVEAEEGASATHADDWEPPPDLPITAKSGQTQPSPPKPKAVNAVTLAKDFGQLRRQYQPGLIDHGEFTILRATFARWHREGRSYRTIETAMHLLINDHLDRQMSAPLGRVFAKHGTQWLEQAEELIWEEDKPARLADYHRRLDEWYDIMRVKLAAVDPSIPFHPSTAQRVLTKKGIPFPEWNG